MSARLCLALSGIVWELVGPGADALTSLRPVQGCDPKAPCPPPRGSHGEEQWALYPKGAWPGKLAHPVRRLPSESYADADKKNAIGKKCSPAGEAAGNYYYNVIKPTLIPYIIDDPQKRKDAVAVVVPGGGHDHLAIDVSGLSVAEWLNSLGISAFVVKYRVPAKLWTEDKKVGLMDVQRAMSVVRKWAIHNGISSDRVILFGSSAGGALAAQLIMRGTDRSYFPIDEVDSVRHNPDYAMLLYPGLTDWEFDFKEAPPKTFIAMAIDDQCASVERAIRYFSAVRRDKAPAELHVYPRGKHGYGTCAMYPEWKINAPVCGWVSKAETWLSAILSPNYTAPETPDPRLGLRPRWCPPKIPSLIACAKTPRACIGHCEGACSEMC